MDSMALPPLGLPMDDGVMGRGTVRRTACNESVVMDPEKRLRYEYE